MVNYDQDTFTLWESNITTMQNPVAVDAPGNPCVEQSDTGNSIVPQLPDNVRKQALSAGQVVGIVLGFCVFFALLALAILYYARTKSSSGSDRSSYQKPELSAEERVRLELPAEEKRSA